MNRGIGLVVVLVMACSIFTGCEGRKAADAEAREIKYATAAEFKGMFEPLSIRTNNWSEYLEMSEYVSPGSGYLGEENEAIVLYRRIQPKDGYIIGDNFSLRVNITYTAREYTTDNGDIYQSIEEGEYSANDLINEIIEVNANDLLNTGILYPIKRIEKDDSGYKLTEYSYSKEQINNVRGVVYKCTIPDNRWNVFDDGNRFIAVRCMFQEDDVFMYFFESGYWTTSQHYKDLDFIIEKEKNLYADDAGIGNWVYALEDIQ